jgi:hypothetical protein
MNDRLPKDIVAATNACFPTGSFAEIRRRLNWMRPGDSFLVFREPSDVHHIAKHAGRKIRSKKIGSGWRITKIA